MLLSIDAQERRVLAHDWVLIGIRSDLHLSGLVVLDEPCPSAALDTCESGVELGLEGGEVAIRGFDGGLRTRNISKSF